MTAQAGAVAYIDLADTPYGRGWTTSHEPLQMPVGRYLHESAAVPVEALEGLVAKWNGPFHGRSSRVDEGARLTYKRCADELDQLLQRLIKERSNG